MQCKQSVAAVKHRFRHTVQPPHIAVTAVTPFSGVCMEWRVGVLFACLLLCILQLQLQVLLLSVGQRPKPRSVADRWLGKSAARP
jgi:hypothetical protein